MKNSKLKITEKDNIITVKKRADIPHCIIFASILIAGIFLPIYFEKLRGIAAFWIVFVLCMIVNTASFVSLFFGKIIIDSEKKEISIYNLCKETHRFDEVDEIQSFSDPRSEGFDSYKIIFIYKNGYRNELNTTSRKQTEELTELLDPIIFERKTHK